MDLMSVDDYVMDKITYVPGRTPVLRQEGRKTIEEMIETNNCFAGIGHELDPNANYTGKVLAFHGDKERVEFKYVETEDLHEYLESLSPQWQERLRTENVMDDLPF